MTNDSLSELQTHSLVFPPMAENLFLVYIHHLSYFGGDDMILGMRLGDFGNRFQRLILWYHLLYVVFDSLHGLVIQVIPMVMGEHQKVNPWIIG